MPLGDQFRNRSATRILVVLVAALLLLAPLAATRADAAAKRTTIPPTCRSSQLRPSLSPPQGTYSPSNDFQATIRFQNIGATCTLTVDNVPVQAVSGRSHKPVGFGSMSGVVAYPPLILNHGDRAFSKVSIGSISTPAFKKMVREHGSSCGPKYADGIEVISNSAVRTDSWPSHYFVLPEKVSICTKDYFNVAAGVIKKMPSPGGVRSSASLQLTQTSPRLNKALAGDSSCTWTRQAQPTLTDLHLTPLAWAKSWQRSATQGLGSRIHGCLWPGALNRNSTGSHSILEEIRVADICVLKRNRPKVSLGKGLTTRGFLCGGKEIRTPDPLRAMPIFPIHGVFLPSKSG